MSSAYSSARRIAIPWAGVARAKDRSTCWAISGIGVPAASPAIRTELTSFPPGGTAREHRSGPNVADAFPHPSIPASSSSYSPRIVLYGSTASSHASDHAVPAPAVVLTTLARKPRVCIATMSSSPSTTTTGFVRSSDRRCAPNSGSGRPRQARYDLHFLHPSGESQC